MSNKYGIDETARYFGHNVIIKIRDVLATQRAEFLSRLHILHRKIIDENLKRGMKAEDHIKYNDHFNSEFDEWEKRK